MLHYDRIDIRKGVDPIKSNKSREYRICHYWFFNHEFKFKDYACNGCQDLTMLNVNISKLLLLMLKMLIIVVLFTILAYLKQLIY